MTRLDNHNPEDRQRLVEALCSEGYHASEYDSGGGTVHIVVPLLDVGSNQLWIATGSINSLCDVSLMGWREGEQVQADTWIIAQSVADVIANFGQFWKERELWVKRFYLGELDI